MIVAYDLRYASDHFAGVGTYAYSLIEALLDLPGDERYLLLWDPAWPTTRYDLDRLRSHARVTWVEKRAHPIQPQGALAIGTWLRRVRPAVYVSPFSMRPIAAGCPEVLTLHDLTPLRMRHAPSAFVKLLFLASLEHTLRARFLLTVSDFSRAEILALTRARAERVRVARPGVAPNVSRAQPCRPGSLPEGPFALVVGDNRPRKNLETIARAWAALGTAPPLTLVAVGPVDGRFGSLADFARRVDARGVVHLGWVSPAELAWLYERAEMLVFPSLYEGFGSPLAEALARGLPVLASDIPVVREVGEGAVTCVPPQDPAAWAAAVRRLAADPAERARMRAAGLARAAELTYGKTAEAVLAVLREAARR